MPKKAAVYSHAESVTRNRLSLDVIQAIADRGMTQRDASARMGISLTTISSIFGQHARGSREAFNRVKSLELRTAYHRIPKLDKEPVYSHEMENAINDLKFVVDQIRASGVPLFGFAANRFAFKHKMRLRNETASFAKGVVAHGYTPQDVEMCQKHSITIVEALWPDVAKGLVLPPERKAVPVDAIANTTVRVLSREALAKEVMQEKKEEEEAAAAYAKGLYFEEIDARMPVPEVSPAPEATTPEAPTPAETEASVSASVNANLSAVLTALPALKNHQEIADVLVKIANTLCEIVRQNPKVELRYPAPADLHPKAAEKLREFVS